MTSVSSLWAGTGEQNSRNSISPGGGIYKSGDGGKTWKLMGLEKTQQIGRIVVHPTDPNIVYVAALGHVWDANPERGLYKTIDGGKSWQLIKFVSDKAGFVDVAMDPSNSDVLYASSYERSRGPYFLKSGGIGSALWKSADAGKTWAKVEGGGFPETQKGRISVAISRSNPGTVYALVEADSVRGATHALRAPSRIPGSRRAAPPPDARRRAGFRHRSCPACVACRRSGAVRRHGHSRSRARSELAEGQDRNGVPETDPISDVDLREHRLWNPSLREAAQV